jgi:tRNA pseudouridine38-40 synthase
VGNRHALRAVASLAAMPRFKLTIEYDGAPFAGWQVQANGPTIQGRIEEAFGKLEQGEISVRGAGRTDAGVHALGQIAHVDLARDWHPHRLREALNAHLRPDPISILTVEAVASDFDARFSARSRSYLYRILNRRAPPSLDKDRVWHITHPLNSESMHEAAQGLLGKHDFTTYRAAQCQAESPIKTLDRLDVRRAGQEIHIEATARSFLHHQVRSMVGSLKLVGEGRWSIMHPRSALDARDRAASGVVAPPQGLYLVRVLY